MSDATVLTGSSKLKTALALDERVLEYVVGLAPHDFARLRNPFMRRAMSPRITLERIATMVELPVVELVGGIYRAARLDVDEAALAELRRGPRASSPRTPHEAPAWIDEEPVEVVDLLESDDRLDADPMPPIQRALKGADPGQVVLIRHRWEPQPLYDVWSKTGHEHYARRESADPDVWHVWVRRAR